MSAVVDHGEFAAHRVAGFCLRDEVVNTRPHEKARRALAVPSDRAIAGHAIELADEFTRRGENAHAGSQRQVGKGQGCAVHADEEGVGIRVRLRPSGRPRGTQLQALIPPSVPIHSALFS